MLWREDSKTDLDSKFFPPHPPPPHTPVRFARGKLPLGNGYLLPIMTNTQKNINNA